MLLVDALTSRFEFSSQFNRNTISFVFAFDFLLRTAHFAACLVVSTDKYDFYDSVNKRERRGESEKKK